KKGQCLYAGCIPQRISDEVKQKGADVYDFMKDEALTLYNTIATAEGAIAEAISNSPENLGHSSCLVLGYG
ncbi:dipicolinate synthase, partial [[Clostridium] scindens]|nr:dipicolinate synthase [[Clostridium] scindens]